MSDTKPESEIPKETSAPKQADKKIDNISSIQGNDTAVQDFRIWKEKHLAHEDQDLAKDLQKFKDRSIPPYAETGTVQQETQSQIDEAKERSDQHASSALEKMQHKDSRFTPAVEAMRDQGAKPYTTMDTLESFSEPPQVKTLEQDLKVHRYYGGDSLQTSRWVTLDQYESANQTKEKLSLPESNTAQMRANQVVDKGTTVLDGKAAPRFEHAGGGNQIFVPDIHAIHEV